MKIDFAVMKLDSIKVKNFRTLEEEVTVVFGGGVTIVGPNSSGKTNILKAIEMFFTGFDNKYHYCLNRDLPQKLENNQSSLIGVFKLENNDTEIQSLYHELNSCIAEPRELDDTITVYLTFSRSGNPSYRLFHGSRQKEERKNDYNRIQRDLVLLILHSFECHYVPSAKSTDSLYNELLLPFVKKHVSNKLQEKVYEIEESLIEVSTFIDKQLKNANLEGITSSFKLPNNSIEHLLSSFEYHLADPVETEIQRKGMGIQSAAILSSFAWITSQENALHKTSIWLIEEPESYLHPELANSCTHILKSLNEVAHLVTTTHSLTFVPQDPRKIIGTEIIDGYTKCKTFSTYTDATSSIRNSLGVRLSDFFNLGLLNIFVEGKTDRELFKWVLDTVQPHPDKGYQWKNVRNAEFLDFGGTGAIEGFMKATYQHVYNERPIVVVLDGDEAGDKTRKALQNYFSSKKIPFEPNKQFTMLPQGLAVECLFPQKWVTDAHKENPGWFKNFCTDMNGALLPFGYSSNQNKTKLREYLKKRAENENNYRWASTFNKLFCLIDDALEQQKAKLS
ncbi:ATP-dependent nuclease [Vibrio vulnificus]|uniref:ATP-dependent nuclease n=1 Tax=Vibrio vulnificus TaxID=672 RepID=UPI001A938F73|nr:AAA family ATPase [Vibrio vulnificus]MCU8191573.1 AAA family ATPase [Vibrio vulnificus]MDS1839062.1 AAA family ATPase [Vibrio vulnificus]MDS1847690.1 AAA family ATPase [Vibrio vulnificus]